MSETRDDGGKGSGADHGQVPEVSLKRTRGDTREGGGVGTGLGPDGRSQTTAPPDVDLNRVWVGVAAQVWRREPGRLERLAARLLRSPGLARALLTAPSLLLPWLVATVVVLGVGAAATRGTGTPLVALMAPALAGAGISYAYGPGVDPAWELTHGMAVSDRMILLVRVLAVFAVNAVLGLAASAASGAAAAVTFGWLIPMTAVCALALATATLARSAAVGATTGLAGWAVTILSGQASDGQVTAAITDSALVLPYLLFAAGCGALAVLATRVPRGTS